MSYDGSSLNFEFFPFEFQIPLDLMISWNMVKDSSTA
jgi:hypothetical protein